MNFSVSWHRMTFASAMRTFGSLTAQFSQKLNFFVFGVNCLTACIVCSVCFAELIIGEYFSPLFSYRTETDPFPPRHTTLRHRDSPEHRRNRARPAAANGTKNPVYLINGLFSGVPENVVKMSPQ